MYAKSPTLATYLRIGALLSSSALVACGGGGSAETASGTSGTLRLAMTDAPACGYDAVNVTIQKIRVHQSSTAVDSDSGWSDIVLSPAMRVNLLDLTNGVLVELGQTPLPAGKYTQMRLVLASNGATSPLANSLTPTGGSETALDTPSATQSGLKLATNLDVPAGKLADFVLDFDACKSIVKRGNSGKYNLTPVINVVPRLSDAGLRVIGYVDPSMVSGTSTTNVSLQLNGVSLKATPPDSTGKFVLYPVPLGTFDLVVTSNTRVAAVVTAVPVTLSAPTSVNSFSNPIAPPASIFRSLIGTVVPATATARATQALTGGPTVEMAWAPVSDETGTFGFTLPLGASVRTAFSTSPPTPLVLTADVASAAKYSIIASSNGVNKVQPIDVSGVVPPLTFIFP